MKSNQKKVSPLLKGLSLLASVIAAFLCMIILLKSETATAQNVIVNDKPLSSETIQVLENYYRIKVQPGRYWYDHQSGLWGIEGEPARVIFLAGMQLGGSLKASASGGSSGVFINGRELTHFEVNELAKMTQSQIQRGRYWLASNGLAGFEGGVALVNLFQVAHQYYSRSNGSTFYRNSYTGVGSGGDGNTFYVIGKDFSYTN